MISKIKEIISYRDMIIGLVRRDLRGRYKGSFFGFLWNYINPLCQIVVYIVVFSGIFPSTIEKFYVYLMIGMMPWNFFSESLHEGAGCILHQSDMVKKIYFPREVLPLATVTSRFINMLLTFIIIFGVIAVSGIGFTPALILYLLLTMVIEYILALGITLFLSAVNVYFRDVEHITGVFMMALIWMCPIMYSLDQVSHGALYKVVSLNPMTHIINAYHSILYYKVPPDMLRLGVVGIFSIALLILSEIAFHKLERRFAEEL